jgi:hypothetical protein
MAMTADQPSLVHECRWLSPDPNDGSVRIEPGLLLILVSLASIDIAPIVDHYKDLTLGIWVGYGVRVVVLVILGGVVALLNSVQQPLTLVQAPIHAIITLNTDLKVLTSIRPHGIGLI